MFCNFKGTTKAVLKNKFTTLMIFVLFVLPFFRNDSRLIVVIAKKKSFQNCAICLGYEIGTKKNSSKNTKID